MTQMYEVVFYNFSQTSQQLTHTERWQFSIKPFRVYSVVMRDEKKNKEKEQKTIKEEDSPVFEKVIKNWLFRRESGMIRDEVVKALGGSKDDLSYWSIDKPFTEEDEKEVMKLWVLEDL